MLSSRVHHGIAGAAFGAGLLASLLPSNAWCWETAHGPTDNTGFVDVTTKPAEFASKTVGGLGTIAPGAGPVVAPDGTVYVANEQGKLMSFKPDGTPGWSRSIAGRQKVVASPAIGSDGSIYVIGVGVSRDHRGGKTVKRVDAALHVFNSTGGYLGSTKFPEHNGAGGTTASPNLWRFGDSELVMVPALYRREGNTGGGFDVRLLGFSSGGGLVLDQHASTITPEAFGGASLTGSFPASDGKAPRDQDATPFPPVGIFHNPLGGTPFILVSNNDHHLVGFTLSGGALVKSFDLYDDDLFMRSAPAILADRHAIIGVENVRREGADAPVGDYSGGVVFSGPNLNKLAPVTGLQGIYATPTRTADGRAILIQSQLKPEMVVLDGRNVVKKLPLFDRSFTSAAASRTHIFVSTATAFQTFDPSTLAEVSRVLWSGGGKSPPAIGPGGHVYAIADNTLFVFPPSLKQLPPNRVLPESAPTAVSTSGADTKPYKPPLTMNGNRLFACEELDGDNCGKGDYQTIADAFCKKEGFIGSGNIKVDSKKVKAETLDGRYCSKNKCKVFEQIVCANN